MLRHFLRYFESNTLFFESLIEEIPVMHLSLETVLFYLFYHFRRVVLLYNVLLLICVCYFLL